MDFYHKLVSYNWNMAACRLITTGLIFRAEGSRRDTAVASYTAMCCFVYNNILERRNYKPPEQILNDGIGVSDILLWSFTN